MKKRIFRLSVGLLALIMFAAGCGTTSSGETENQGVVDDGVYAYGTVHGVTWSSDGSAERGDDEDVYFEDTGNIRSVLPMSRDSEVFGAAQEGGDLPTVYHVSATEAQGLIAAGWGRPIQEQVAVAGIDLTSFDQTVLQSYMDKEGNLYGLPYSANILGIIANGDLFIEAGVVDENGNPKAPATWDELVGTAKTIHEKTGKGGFTLTARDYSLSRNFMNVAWNYGADLCIKNEDGSLTANLNTPEVADAMECYRELVISGAVYGDPFMDDTNTVLSYLQYGKTAMMFNSSDCAGITGADAMEADNLFLFAVPAGPGGRYNLAESSGCMFASYAEDEQIVAFLEYMMHYGVWSATWTGDAKTVQQQVWADAVKNEQLVIPSISVYETPWQDEYLAEMKNYQTHFDYDAQFGDFFETVEEAGVLLLEEEGDTNNLYRELAAVLQEILINPEEVNIPAMLETANENYETFLEAWN